MAFSAQLLINGVDYYAQLTDELTVSIEEGAARLASFTLDPFPGAIDPYIWIGQAVQIDFIDGSTDRLFTGVVHTVDYDIDAGTTKFTCTDGLQEKFETVPRAEADQLISGGVWTDKIFRAPKDNWDFAQQKLSTYPGSMDKSPAGALRVTAWAAKVTPDYTYTAATIDSGTLKIDQLAERRSITNSIKITFTSAFQLLRQREESISWGIDQSFYDYLALSYLLPERKAIESAVKDWVLKSITYTDLPPSGTIVGTGPDIIWTHNAYSDAICLGFSASLAIRYRQDIAAEYTITVANSASIAQHGLLQAEQNYTINHKTKGRADDFLKFDSYKAPEGSAINTTATGIEYAQSVQGDDSLAQLCALSIAKTKILQSHRQNRISFECALNAGLDVDKTVRIEHPKLTAQGKVYGIEHRINVLEGFAVTKCTVAITLPSIAGQSEDTLSRANVPYATNPLDFTPPSDPPTFPALGNHIGNADGVPAEDAAWNGMVTNYDVYLGVSTPIVYSTHFAVTTPALDATDYNAWLNDTIELQTKLVKSGASYFQRILFGNEPIVAGDQVKLYDGNTLHDTHTVTSGDLNLGYYQIAAINSRQDEKAITHLISSSYNVALPVETLEIVK